MSTKNTIDAATDQHSTALSRSFEIRPAGPDDFELWLPLWRSYQKFYKVDIPTAVTIETWDRLLNPTEPMRAALAFRAEQALGLIHSIYHRSTWTNDDYCYLQDLYVASEARGSGIGRGLIEHVYSEAKRQGAARVYWTTHETNQNAMLLYDRIAERSGYILYRKLLG